MTSAQLAARVGLAVSGAVAAGLAVALGAAAATATVGALFFAAALALESITRTAASTGAPPSSKPFAPPDQLGARRTEPAVPEELEKLQRLMSFSAHNAGDWHFRLRPILRELADALLQDRHGVRLDGDPRAPDTLGTRAWAALRADRPPPEDRLGPGLAAAELERVVHQIEELA